MLGAGLQFGRSRREDRFYIPAKARSDKRNQLNQDQVRSSQSPAYREPENQSESEESPKPVHFPALKPVVSPLCNLERFLASITLEVPAQYLSKTTMRGWSSFDVDFQPYFVLGDLWESFREWSAYGAGVPLILNDTDSVVQYYVPYLSGIQLYGSSANPSQCNRQGLENSDSDYCKDSSSDGSIDWEQEQTGSFREQHNSTYYKQTNSALPGMDSLLEGSSSDEVESGNSQGILLFEYLERESPFNRVPLVDKISDLAVRFPGLKMLRSSDLLPSSWVSVAWYPIYRIPIGPTMKDLNACFLTFHSLHTPMTVADTQTTHSPHVIYPKESDDIPKISLPVFGLASYKFKVSIWTPDLGCKRQLVNSLLQAAKTWLALLQVSHPDFVFFCHPTQK